MKRSGEIESASGQYVRNAFCVCLDVSRVRHKTTKKVYDHGHTVETGVQMQRTMVLDATAQEPREGPKLRLRLSCDGPRRRSSTRPHPARRCCIRSALKQFGPSWRRAVCGSPWASGECGQAASLHRAPHLSLCSCALWPRFTHVCARVEQLEATREVLE